MHLAMASGDRLMFRPRFSSTSALPLLLETLRPPCLLTLAPAAALYAANVADSIEAGIAKARSAIESGAAKAKLDDLIKVSKSLAS
jgi:anthranilate phosphoribosyltransferase